ncbi:MAG: pseudaminic acid synthase [Candidatus Nanoarchaeia archaeon]|nr:pseudaminic acid synthase [Candidatus Nanoarchaeia archaeon]
MAEIKFGNRKISDDGPVFIVAEVSGNHQQSYDKAEKIVRAACEAGVDAIKLQTYTPDTMTIDCDKEWFQIKTNDAWKGQTLYQLYKKAYTPWEWHSPLAEIAGEYNVPLFSAPFDATAVDFLEKMSVPAYKIASFEIADLELLKKIASTGKPVIMSRGMASLEELELAYRTLRENGSGNIAILHCISSYPATPEEMNLSTIPDLKKRFPDAVIGLSDHTLTTETAVAGVALGAEIIEKHITLDRKDGGPDAAFSLEPREFKELVKQIRNAGKAIGHPRYGHEGKESENAVFRRSIFVVKDIKEGEELNRQNLRVIRPGYGLPPKDLEKVLGKKSKKYIERGTPLSWDLIE